MIREDNGGNVRRGVGIQRGASWQRLHSFRHSRQFLAGIQGAEEGVRAWGLGVELTILCPCERREKTLDSRLRLTGMTGGETYGNDRRELAGRTGGEPAGMAGGEMREGHIRPAPLCGAAGSRSSTTLKLCRRVQSGLAEAGIHGLMTRRECRR